MLHILKISITYSFQFCYRVVCIDDKFSKPIVLFRGGNDVYKFIQAIHKEYHYYQQIIKRNLNKKLVLYAEDEERFQSSNDCRIYKKLFDVGDNKITDHNHVTEKCRGSAHWNCNINPKLTKNVPVIFHNLRGYESHLIMEEIGKVDEKVSVIRNVLKKYMAFKISNSLVYIESM